MSFEKDTRGREGREREGRERKGKEDKGKYRLLHYEIRVDPRGKNRDTEVVTMSYQSSA